MEGGKKIVNSKWVEEYLMRDSKMNLYIQGVALNLRGISESMINVGEYSDASVLINAIGILKKHFVSVDLVNLVPIKTESKKEEADKKDEEWNDARITLESFSTLRDRPNHFYKSGDTLEGFEVLSTEKDGLIAILNKYFYSCGVDHHLRWFDVGGRMFYCDDCCEHLDHTNLFPFATFDTLVAQILANELNIKCALCSECGYRIYESPIDSSLNKGVYHVYCQPADDKCDSSRFGLMEKQKDGSGYKCATCGKCDPKNFICRVHKNHYICADTKCKSMCMESQIKVPDSMRSKLKLKTSEVKKKDKDIKKEKEDKKEKKKEVKREDEPKIRNLDKKSDKPDRIRVSEEKTVLSSFDDEPKREVINAQQGIGASNNNVLTKYSRMALPSIEDIEKDAKPRVEIKRIECPACHEVKCKCSSIR